MNHPIHPKKKKLINDFENQRKVGTLEYQDFIQQLKYFIKFLLFFKEREIKLKNNILDTTQVFGIFLGTSIQYIINGENEYDFH